MNLALAEAAKARGQTSPNPLVGAVLVKNNQMLAKGFHHGPGKAHAEVAAFQKIKNKKNLKGATLYVTLEPCCHTKKRTPPCVNAVIASGVKAVVLGMKDPNPQVSGKGIQKLKRAGISVKVGVLQKECEALNHTYIHWMETGKPYVILKMASSLDGKIALANGKSRWITSPASRQHVHQTRAQVDAVLVGVGTVLQDDPQLNARLSKRKKISQPKRIVLDPHLRTPKQAQVLNPKLGGETIIIARKEKLSSSKAKGLVKQGVKLLSCPVNSRGRFPLATLLKKLGDLEILSLLVEGGPFVWTEFLQQKVSNEIQLYLSPQFLGGDAKSLLSELKLKRLPGLQGLSFHTLLQIGEDLLINLRV